MNSDREKFAQLLHEYDEAVDAYSYAWRSSNTLPDPERRDRVRLAQANLERFATRASWPEVSEDELVCFMDDAVNQEDIKNYVPVHKLRIITKAILTRWPHTGEKA